MIFSPQLARLVVAGRKTMTRRPVQEPRLVTRGNGTSYTSRPFRPTVGKSVAVQQGRGRTAEARIVITEVRREFAGDITFEDARAEGFRTTDEFRAYWLGLYDRAWLEQTDQLLANLAASEERLAQDLDLTEAVVRRRLRFLERAGAVTLELPVEGLWLREEGAEHTAAQARFADRHADTLVDVITFELDRSHEPRLLAPASRGERDGDEHGYTTDPALALPGEPEAVDAGTVASFAAKARERHDALRAGVDAQLLDQQRTLLERHALLERLAYERGIDARSELRVVERGLNALERKIRAQRTGQREAA